MANLRNIQFLRSSSIYANLDAAKSALSEKAANLLDGSPIIGRYLSGETGSEIELSVIGIVHKNASGTGVTFFESANDVADRLAQLQAELDAAEAAVGLASGGTKVGQEGEYISGKTTVEAEIKALNDALEEVASYVNGLDYGPIGGTDASVLTQIQQADGKISGQTANVGTLLLTDYTKGSDSGSVAATDSINAAMSKLENQIDAANNKVNALDYNLAADDNKVVVSLNQTDGAVSGASINISGIKLAGYLEASSVADVADTDTLGEALGKLQKTIHGMDKTANAVAGQVVTTVSEADGVVSETKANVKDLQLGGYAKTNDTGDIASADTINVALSKLENKAAAITINNEDGSINVTPTTSGTDISVNIKSGEHVLAKDGNAGVYTDIKLSGITPSSTTVKEEFALLGTDGEQLGSSIKIYKDSSLVSMELVSGGTAAEPKEYLRYTYIDASGNTQTTDVDVSLLLAENEFKSGLTVTAAGIVTGVVDTTSEAFLTVGEGGFKLSGVQNAIDSAVSGLDASVSAETAHVTVKVDEVDGKLTAVTLTETNIANADDLATLSGKTLTNVTSANSSITPTITTHTDGTKTVDIVTDASKVKMTGFTADESGFTAITTASTVTEAVKAIETAFIDNEEVTSNALNDLNDRVDELSGKTFTEITSPNNSIAFTTAATTDGTVGVSATTDASKISGLIAVASVTDEITGVSASDSVQTGIKNLYDSLAAEIAARKAAISSTTINGSDAINVTRSESGDTVSLILDDSTTSSDSNSSYVSETGNNVLKITNDGLYLDGVWNCGTFD